MKKRISLFAIVVFAIMSLFSTTLFADSSTTADDTVVYLPVILTPIKVLLFDDFSDPESGWPVSDGTVRRQYENDEYEIRIANSGLWGSARAPVDASDDYGVEADMRRRQGTTSYYGLAFDVQDWDNYFLLLVDPSDQWYGVAKYVDGKSSIVIPLTNSNAVNPDSETNHLRVERTGDEIAVYINGEFMESSMASGFEGTPGVGFYLVSNSDEPARVRYDNFRLWDLTTGTSQEVQGDSYEMFSNCSVIETCQMDGVWSPFD